jgi:hypothetical protein
MSLHGIVRGFARVTVDARQSRLIKSDLFACARLKQFLVKAFPKAFWVRHAGLLAHPRHGLVRLVGAHVEFGYDFIKGLSGIVAAVSMLFVREGY